jgi:hypothetical protein
MGSTTVPLRAPASPPRPPVPAAAKSAGPPKPPNPAAVAPAPVAPAPVNPAPVAAPVAPAPVNPAPVAAVESATPVAPAPVNPAPVAAVESATPVAAPTTSAAPTAPATGDAAPKKRGRKKGAGGGAKKKDRETYYGLFVYEQRTNPETNAVENVPVYIEVDGENVPKRQKLTAIPTDFDPNKHEKLKEQDFANVAMFWDFTAAQFTKRAAACKAKADRMRTLGSVADNDRAQKLIKMREKQAQLMAQLKAEGVDVDALMAAADAPAENVAA